MNKKEYKLGMSRIILVYSKLLKVHPRTSKKKLWYRAVKEVFNKYYNKRRKRV